MDGNKFLSIVRKYKKCPNCGKSYKEPDFGIELKDEIITISCTCGFIKKVSQLPPLRV